MSAQTKVDEFEAEANKALDMIVHTLKTNYPDGSTGSDCAKGFSILLLTNMGMMKEQPKMAVAVMTVAMMRVLAHAEGKFEVSA